jgi:hypothetical protein
MQTDREKAIEKLWQNSEYSTRWASVAAAYDAGMAAANAAHEQALAVALADARMVERERCARLCEENAYEVGSALAAILRA